MLTAQATSTAVSATDIAISLGLLVAVYAVLGLLWLFLVVREISHGPAPAPAGVVEEETLPLPSAGPLLRPAGGPMAGSGR